MRRNLNSLRCSEKDLVGEMGIAELNRKAAIEQNHTKGGVNGKMIMRHKVNANENVLSKVFANDEVKGKGVREIGEFQS